jgi:hypothetical protein
LKWMNNFCKRGCIWRFKISAYASGVLKEVICTFSLLLSQQPLCHQFQASILNWLQ